MRRPILNNSSPGQAVYEPFMGSGTTLIAAETTGRVCLGIDLNPAYVDVEVERWQQFTRKTAATEGDGGVLLPKLTVAAAPFLEPKCRPRYLRAAQRPMRCGRDGPSD